MAKDARGHGSNGVLAPNAQNTAPSPAAGLLRKSFQNIYGGNQQAAQALASGPKSAPVPTHDAMEYYSPPQGPSHSWGNKEWGTKR